MRRALGLALVVLLTLASAPAKAVSRHFPRGFLWGTATSAFQAEMGAGRNVDRGSDWWVWSHDPANIAAHRVSGDVPENGPGEFALFRTDVRLASRQLHNNAMRISIEWSRIFPRSTASARSMRQLDRLADHRAVRHYMAELLAIRGAGMTPFVTVEHFTLPAWLHDPIAGRDALARVGPYDPPPSFARAGWLDPSIVSEFRKYASYLAWKFGRLVDLWNPINEPFVEASSAYANIPGVLASFFPPGALNYQAALRAVQRMEL